MTWHCAFYRTPCAHAVWMWFSILVPGARSSPIRIPIKFIKCISNPPRMKRQTKESKTAMEKIDSNVRPIFDPTGCTGTGWANWYWIVIVWVKIQAHFDFQIITKNKKNNEKRSRTDCGCCFSVRRTGRTERIYSESFLWWLLIVKVNKIGPATPAQSTRLDCMHYSVSQNDISILDIQ